MNLPRNLRAGALLAIVIVHADPEALAQLGATERVSVATGGGQAWGDSGQPSISADGRYVAFQSWAQELVPGDTLFYEDIFVHDRLTGVTTRVSVDAGGLQANGQSFNPFLSLDGRYVAFESKADNLVPGDMNLKTDVFVHDRQTGQTERVSVDSAGIEGNDDSREPSISSDGRYVAFESMSDSLVPSDTNGASDVFVHDRVTGQTELVSVNSNGSQGNLHSWRPSISADGRYVAFDSSSSNMVPMDTNPGTDVFVRDRLTSETTRVSVISGGGEASGASRRPSMSSDGRLVAFESQAALVPGDTNPGWNVFVHDRQTSMTTLISMSSAGVGGNDDSSLPAMSPDGLFVTFTSEASNLVSMDTNGSYDIFVHERSTRRTTRVNVSSDGAQANHVSYYSSIASGGSQIAFASAASNLVVGDSNGYDDVFVHELPEPVGTPYCFGDGSGVPCPCANTGTAGAGCMNSAGLGCVFSGFGSPSVSSRDLVLTATHALPNQPGLFFQGNNAINGGDGVQFGDGLRCAGGGLVRLEIETADGSGSAASTVPIAATGGVTPGDTKYYQWWYRDPNGSPCGNGFNLSNGLEVTWAP